MTTPEDPTPTEATPAPRREGLFGAGPAILWFEAWPVMVILALIWIVFLAQSAFELLGDGETIFVLGGLWKPGVFQGLWWTPLTHMFMHMSWGQPWGWLHIVFNSGALVALGPAIAQRFGRDALGGALFFAFYLACGLAGAGAFILLGADRLLVVGASGAIFGLWGAVARLGAPGEAKLAPIFAPSVLRQVGSALISNLVVLGGAAGYGALSGSGAGVAWQAHLGGFVLGFLLIPILPVRFHWLKGARTA
ncbi:rhomboid family intramembrane serine protease [Caulobacter sp. D4A]|uniref:rhomboid family intramembrane serine protease n=1 Tax=unclassified Caulobacter TaxID=2648921 RepID=UPI000D733DD7|nr:MULTISPECIES: rhomboid family intramembrane serine protease [unclassified Caulobacter]PXA94358.1 rhomboid family intramembrane serine protease [Caulobacter sp. D5]PXA95076.1 rhomboid family intramembrane serine protease [Caulobacter sp. D4A]